MFKMGSHDSFGHLKHQLWPKVRSGIKLAIWLPTTKSRESTRFPCVQVVSHILLERSRQGLQLYFKLHFNRRSVHKVMGPQSCGSPNFGNFGTPLGQNAIWMWASWRGTNYNIKGKVVASPKSRPWWVLWVWICPWLVLAPKVLKLCIN
jgi:hypothetical protein